MNILNVVRTLLVAKPAVVTLTPPQEAKDNTPVNRRLNRMIRIKRSLKTLQDKGKREQLEAELKAHLAELEANSVALQFLKDVDGQ